MFSFKNETWFVTGASNKYEGNFIKLITDPLWEKNQDQD